MSATIKAKQRLCAEGQNTLGRAHSHKWPCAMGGECVVQGMLHGMLHHTWAGGLSGGGGVNRAPWLAPPPKRGSIDGTPKTLPRLTPGPQR